MAEERPGKLRLAILLLVLLFLGALAAVYILKGGVTAPTTPPAVVEGVMANQNSLPRGHCLFLKANSDNYIYQYQGIVAREIFRQAVLTAARDELGLTTRDASLREWAGEPPAGSSMEMHFGANGPYLIDGDPPVHRRWQHGFDTNIWPSDLDQMVIDEEVRSRGEFLDALKRSGWSGQADSWQPNDPAPEDVESKLGQMDEIVQFGVLREVHGAIREHGESPARLGALVRAYANLGQLTRYHWSLEHAAYAARSLLYAQRLVVKCPNSAIALWDRAYARAMIGMPGGALDDLHQAAQLNEKPPEWVSLLEPFCQYHTGVLVNLATAHSEISGLGMYLAFLSVEHSGCQAAIMNISAAALEMNPGCLRIIDSMCDHTGPGMLNSLVDQGPEVFSKMLPDRLQKVPEFPEKLSLEIDGFRQPDGNPNGRKIICDELVAAGSADQDATEPSWTALGRLVEETTFAHVETKANLISQEWGVDASDYVAQVQPLIAGHPFKFLIDVYGLVHSADTATLKRAMHEPQDCEMALSLKEIHVEDMDMQILPDGPGSADNTWGWFVGNTDYNSFDIEDQMNMTRERRNDRWTPEAISRLRRVAPDSPVLIAEEIRANWDEGKAAKWESEHGDYPTVALALGKAYASHQRWEDAERNLRQYIAVSPDRDGYEDLAKIYQSQHDDATWLATLNECIDRTQEFGLDHAIIQSEIANYYMGKGDYRSAVPYADAASQTGASWAYLCAANAHTGIGDWATAEQLVKEEIDHYSESPFTWYSWCLRTGHGDLKKATQATEDYFAVKAKQLTKEDLVQLGVYQMCEGKPGEALATFQQREKLFPGPLSLLHIAVLADQLGDSAESIDALSKVQKIKGISQDDRLSGFARLLRNAHGDKPTLSDVQAAAGSATQDDQIAINALAAVYFDNHGRANDAKACLMNGAGVLVGYDVDQCLIYAMMRKKGMDPMSVKTVAMRPGQN